MDTKCGWGLLYSTCEGGLGRIEVINLCNNTFCFIILILLDYGGPITPNRCFACIHAPLHPFNQTHAPMQPCNPCTHEPMHHA